jgi:hypothetical protein
MDTEANRLKYQTDSQATFGEGTTTKRIIAERIDEVKSKKKNANKLSISHRT